MKQKTIFLFFCMIFVAGSVFSQNVNTKTSNLLFASFVKKPVKASLSTFNNADFVAPPKQYLPADFYVSQIGFFCKQEIKFEKLTKIPFRFRLGSVEECDRMEGKYK
jgi:hypothetical protein